MSRWLLCWTVLVALDVEGDMLGNHAIVVTDSRCCSYGGCLSDDWYIGCMASEALCCIEVEFCCKSLCYVCCTIRNDSPTAYFASQAQVCCNFGVGAISCDEEMSHIFGTCDIFCYPVAFWLLFLGFDPIFHRAGFGACEKGDMVYTTRGRIGASSLTMLVWATVPGIEPQAQAGCRVGASAIPCGVMPCKFSTCGFICYPRA
ncbi:unnamed protein product [Prorocentrum cordatum]|uniref:Secreted protein n=1 Tax=Prorocentrum cordatum TaxID=2364126 RepID=A0ABN9TWV6_9DINO|nr:unnamed protein product [Polarella glacialis]